MKSVNEPGRNPYLLWFSIVIWIGIAANALFWVPALVHPETISKVLDQDPNFQTIWLRNVGMLLILVAIFNAAAALAPARYPLVSWLVVAARFIAASFFLEVFLFNSLDSSDRPEVFLWFFIVDGSFGTVKGVLLYAGLRRVRSRAGST
jgi:uncharacterized membrane protein